MLGKVTAALRQRAHPIRLNAKPCCVAAAPRSHLPPCAAELLVLRRAGDRGSLLHQASSCSTLRIPSLALPGRGILFHGAPGCGKTLLARALAGECNLHSPVPVALFARKGADCLGKYSGEAERNLRLLFAEVRLPFCAQTCNYGGMAEHTHGNLLQACRLLVAEVAFRLLVVGSMQCTTRGGDLCRCV